MSPPLVAKFVCGYKVGQIDVVLLLHAADKADSFRVGNRIREGLGKAAIARELKNSILRELIWAEVRLVIIKTSPRTRQHIVYVVGVRRVVVDLEIHRSVRARVHLLAPRILSRYVGIEILDMRRTHAVLVIVAAILLPRALQVARSNSNLIARGAYD